jgi:hypothetical protein
MDWVGELYSITTYDGQTLVLDGEARFLTTGLFGAPPTTYRTRQGYKQHGATEVDYTLDPRRLSFRLWYAAQTPRQAYWDARQRLLNFLRPNRGGPLQLTVWLPDGTQRAIIARADPGLQFPPETDRNSWSIEEPVDFIAFDPVWFDPDEVTISMTQEAEPAALVLPFSSPFTLGASGLVLTTGALTYAGTWQTFPLLTLTGPYDNVTVIHEELGITLFLAVPIGVNEQRFLDLTPGALALVDGSGINRFGDLGPGANLVDFRLLPDPEMPNGVQTLRAILHGGVLAQSAASLRYFTRYFGI